MVFTLTYLLGILIFVILAIIIFKLFIKSTSLFFNILLLIVLVYITLFISSKMFGFNLNLKSVTGFILEIFK